MVFLQEVESWFSDRKSEVLTAIRQEDNWQKAEKSNLNRHNQSTRLAGGSNSSLVYFLNNMIQMS